MNRNYHIYHMAGWVIGVWLWTITTAAWGWVPLVVNGRCLQSGNGCWTSIGNAGSSAGCCDPRQGNLAACIKANTCVGSHAYRWPRSDLPVLWYFNDNQMAGKEGYSKHSVSQLEQSMKTAWDAWTKPECTSFRHQYGGRTSRKSYWEDQVVVLYFAASAEWAQLGISPGVLAFSLPIPDDKGNIRDGDIVFNPQPLGFAWGVSSVATQEVDLTDVATHEVGHTIGFGHSESQTAVMYYSVRGLGPLFQGLSNDEKQAICATYPQQQGCTKDDTCGACRVCNQGSCEDQTKTAATTCQPCRSNQDCGTDGRCAQTTDGNRCLQPCGANKCCPTKYHCKAFAGQDSCVPIHGSCAPVTCQSDTDCGPGETCTGTPQTCQLTKPPRYYPACQTGCKADSDCSTNEKCVAISAETRRCVVPCNNGLFCPHGFVCQRLIDQNFCMPQDAPFCPCRNKGDCATGQDCVNEICQTPQAGKAGDRCNDKARCQKGLLCISLSDRQICALSCDPSASVVPTGTLGGPCRIDRSCDAGLDCQRLPNGPWLCLQPCQSKTDCTHGGSCAALATGQKSYCLCRESKECSQGAQCNNAPTLLSAPVSGACAPAPLSSQCPNNFECVTAGGALKLCLPKPSRKEKEPCDAINRCIGDFKCLPNPAKPGEWLCLMPCSNNSVCSAQGVCLDVGSQKACLCSEDAHCPAGHTCDTSWFSGKGFCKCTSGICKNCGNGTCDEKDGENCETCPADCGCKAPKKCFKGACTGYCGDQVCDPSENCTNCPDCNCPQGQECALGECRTFCGNGTCDKGEDCTSCVSDCACPNNKQCKAGACVGYCGDNTCDVSENCTTCARDCGCPQDKVCIRGQCQDKSQQKDCGNGTCEISKGEGCANCPTDCRCDITHQCVQNVCRSRPEGTIPDLPAPPDDTSAKGCNCNTSPTNDPFTPLGWCFLVIILWVMRRV